MSILRLSYISKRRDESQSLNPCILITALPVQPATYLHTPRNPIRRPQSFIHSDTRSTLQYLCTYITFVIFSLLFFSFLFLYMSIFTTVHACICVCLCVYKYLYACMYGSTYFRVHVCFYFSTLTAFVMGSRQCFENDSDVKSIPKGKLEARSDSTRQTNRCSIKICYTFFKFPTIFLKLIQY